MFKSVDPKIPASEREKKVTRFWKKNQIFEKSIQNRREAPIYSFFDGPPFITGVPHHGTLLSSISKDVVPRYWTMKGYRVDRRWGWDCHGLPAENLVEKQLGVKSKKEIEENVGIERFVKECYKATTKMASEWEEFIDRIGRWVDFKNAYRTMDSDYMESVWWAFKELYNKDLIYKDTRISLYCPRCSTPLANFEIAMDSSYQDVTDTAIFVRFSIFSPNKEKLGIPYNENGYLIAWTTTPWTLLANTGLAVNNDLEYVTVIIKDDSKKKDKKPTYYVLGKVAWERFQKEFNIKGKIISTFKGSELIGVKYERLWREEKRKDKDDKNLKEKGLRVVMGDFVQENEGSGIVHIAPAFGEDDYNIAKKEELPTILNVDEEGKFISGKFEGRNVWEANLDIISELKKKKNVVAEEQLVHSYPFCHRCHTKLIYKTQPAWFIRVSNLKDSLIANNEKINWHPEFLKHGRFLKGIESAPDWNISRDRYWGTAIPIWECEKCNKHIVVGSYDELYQYSGQRLEDYHLPYVNRITFKCPDCGGEAHRVPQILDCWVESGSMPFAERHYPFKNQEDFNQKFPADFISEYIGQTRAWFYVLHVLAVALFQKPAFKNVVTTGVIAGRDGRKMSKSLGNYTDPKEILEKFSADALRFYFMSSPIMEAENMNFTDEKVGEIQKGMLRAWWNSYFFFVTYARLDKWTPSEEAPLRWSEPQSFREAWHKPESVLDAWIMSELHTLIRDMNKLMDEYEIAKAARLLPPFIDKVSNWYIRRSRKRFWKSENDGDKSEAYQTLYEVLTKIGQSAAHFLPFLTEEIYQNINRVSDKATNDPETLNHESIHLTSFPEANPMLIDEELNNAMERIRHIVTLGLSCRAKKGIKVRQPLMTLYVSSLDNISDELWNLVREELNIKQIIEREDLKNIVEKDKYPKELSGMIDRDEVVALDIRIDKELLLEGEMREMVRQIQEARKKAGFNIEDRIILGYIGKEELFEHFGSIISNEVLASELVSGDIPGKDYSFDIQFGKIIARISLKKI